jgi:transposase
VEILLYGPFSQLEQLGLLDQVEQSIKKTRKRIGQLIKRKSAMQPLQTLPDVGPILAIGIALEVGSIDRFPTAEKLASYAGKVPRVNSTGGKTYYGKVRPDVNGHFK